MKISGIVCEYNPFHNGHLYHINQTRENGATHIVAVMSGNFVQRGDVAIIDKFERAQTAVKSGVDLVIEIPVAYSVSTAEVYARGALYLLNALGCVDEVSFGSECGSLELLVEAVKASVTCAKKPELRELIEDGMSYPVALRILVERNYGTEMAILFDGSNNVLAIEYIKALAFLSSDITPFTIQRKGAIHDNMSKPAGNIASASFIRQSISSQSDFSDFLPEETLQSLLNATRNSSMANIDNLEKIILYKLRNTTIESLRDVPDIGQGLENRIYDARTATSLKELFFTIKTKRYSMARIRRILLNTLLGIRKSDLINPPPFGRILAVNQRGCDILSVAKTKASIPFATSLAKLGEINDTARHFADLEARAGDIFALATKEIQPCGKDFTAKIAIT
ncbi:MAG: nucleotidyltransferase family protein [Oscillospiraceae bacterium]|jgi:predicted nucleotidyltransferase|nr:nucleotidyltransferase family protein [Oscillospiraceae bacterium]